jgi:hypothetical protein
MSFIGQRVTYKCIGRLFLRNHIQKHDKVGVRQRNEEELHVENVLNPKDNRLHETDLLQSWRHSHKQRTAD